MNYLYWDIDGTLLLTSRAGSDALIEAIKLKFNIRDFTFSHSLAGCTDTYIVKTAIKEIKGTCSAADAAGLLIHYYRLLPEYLSKRQGHLLPNIANTLQSLHQDNKKSFTSALLTGNATLAAHMKLKHFGLEKYFNYPLSVFGELSEDRNLLAQIAFHKLNLVTPNIEPENIIIIGDTPNDIKCAQAIGARSLIILAGSSYSEKELASHNPWKIIKELPFDTREFIDELA